VRAFFARYINKLIVYMRAKFVFVQQFDAEIRDDLKKDLLDMSKDEFDDFVKYAGYNKKRIHRRYIKA